ncbi:CLUMA_CG007201, isoform A [Clunio marinus]|uniref:CLUMA_CG007201, isoform A n=1 Tax=Clunio marinus TaxID=568069 RepID=A0A1J1I001_9DIPT|nr:CLUMA_CG007201, isoform A [Clunio marinus]
MAGWKKKCVENKSRVEAKHSLFLLDKYIQGEPYTLTLTELTLNMSLLEVVKEGYDIFTVGCVKLSYEPMLAQFVQGESKRLSVPKCTYTNLISNLNN